MRINYEKSNKALIATVVHLTMMVGCQAAGLRGVGLYETRDYNGLSVSMAGGGLLNIAARGNSFDASTTSN